MATITIADLVSDTKISSGYRVKETGYFASKEQIEIWKLFMDFKEDVKQIKKEEPERIPDDVDREIEELEGKYNDKEYNTPHECFKIKYPNWDKKDERELKKIARNYFQISKSKSNIKAMEYTLTKLKIEKMRSRIK